MHLHERTQKVLIAVGQLAVDQKRDVAIGLQHRPQGDRLRIDGGAAGIGQDRAERF